MKKLLSVFVFLCLALSIASCAAAGSSAKSLSVEGIKSLVIDAASGKVNVYHHNKSCVEVFASDEFEFSNFGGTLKIKFPKKKFQIFDFSKKEITVYLPSNISLDYVDIEVSSASVNFDNLQAKKIEIDSASGTINANGKLVASDIEIETASGAIYANNIEANTVSIDSSSGSVHIGGIIKSELEIESSSGSIHANLVQLPKNTEIDSSSGSVDLKVPQNAGITLKFNSSSGNIKSDLPFVQPMNSRKTYTLGDGSAYVSIETSSGSVKIEAL